MKEKNSERNSNFCSRDIVIFLGSGFSAETTLPVLSKFGEESDNQLKGLEDMLSERNENGEINKKYRKSARLFYDAGTIFKKFQNSLKHVDDVNNLEKVFIEADKLKQRNESFNTGNETISAKELVKQISIWIWKIYHQCPPLNLERQLTKQLIKDYYSFIVNLKEYSNRLTVITTNYDLIFEYFACKNKLKCVYPTIAEEIKITESKENFVDSEKANYHDETIVCKLHGSVNFFVETGKKDNLYISKELGDGKPMGDPPGNTPNCPVDRPAIFAFESPSEILKKLGNGFSPEITPPNYKTVNYNQKYEWQKKIEWQKNIWGQAEKALKNAKKIIFIGYGLPKTDEHMATFIKDAIKNKTEPLKILLIDKQGDDKGKKDLIKKYKKLFKQELEINMNGFSKSIEDIKKFLNDL